MNRELLALGFAMLLGGCPANVQTRPDPNLSISDRPESIRILEKCLSNVNDPYAAAECQAEFRDVYSKKDLMVLAEEYNRFVEAVSKDGFAGISNYNKGSMKGAAPDQVVENFYSAIAAICDVRWVGSFGGSGHGQDVVACETELLKNALHQFHH